MKRMVVVMVAAAIGASMAGCVSKQSTLVDPKTGTPQSCEANGFGWLGVPMALAMQAECESNAKKAGMVPIAEYQAAGGRVVSPGGLESSLIIDSEPPGAEIYAGKTPDATVVRIGKTPYKLANIRSSAWAKECYRSVLDGYKGETQCFDQVTGDRKIHFALQKEGEVTYK